MNLIERLMFNKINTTRKYHGIRPVSEGDYLYGLNYCYQMKLTPNIQTIEDCISFKIVG